MYDIVGWIGIGLGAVTLIIVIVKATLKIGGWKGSVDTDRTNFKEFMSEIKNDIKDIRDSIFNISSQMTTKVADKQSPIRLTNLGKKISAKIDALTWAGRHAERVKENVKGKQPYDIQEFSFMYVQNHKNYSDEERILTRKIAYEEGLTEFEVRQVLGIELRDKLLTVEGKEAP
ncbi:MAG: hypothetical protein OXF48_00610 [Bacteroidetes bacterium]|nr:hypothetical protein [Bacteroidota bacterium]